MPEKVIAFAVYGDAKPAGSKRAFALRRKDGSTVLGKGGTPAIAVVDSSGKAGKDWRQAIAHAARQAYSGDLLRIPLRVVFRFIVPRPKGHFRANGTLAPTAPEHPAKRPDLLKLARAAEDALTNVIWADDSQIYDERLVKQFGEPARLEVTIEWGE